MVHTGALGHPVVTKKPRLPYGGCMAAIRWPCSLFDFKTIAIAVRSCERFVNISTAAHNTIRFVEIATAEQYGHRNICDLSISVSLQGSVTLNQFPLCSSERTQNTGDDCQTILSRFKVLDVLFRAFVARLGSLYYVQKVRTQFESVRVNVVRTSLV